MRHDHDLLVAIERDCLLALLIRFCCEYADAGDGCSGDKE